ncbi:hypothetical protein DFH27DRAFT_529957 [Peziza echinospora]|nr:hypothetical protein DFH27DRAFT_529957 [Peziza echinospora]
MWRERKLGISPTSSVSSPPSLSSGRSSSPASSVASNTSASSHSACICLPLLAGKSHAYIAVPCGSPSVWIQAVSGGIAVPAVTWAKERHCAMLARTLREIILNGEMKAATMQQMIDSLKQGTEVKEKEYDVKAIDVLQQATAFKEVQQREREGASNMRFDALEQMIMRLQLANNPVITVPSSVNPSGGA